MHRGERFQNQVMPGSQMGPLVGEDGRDFVVGESGQRSFADHNPAAHTRQTVGKRLWNVQDAKIARAGAPLGEGHVVSDSHQIDHHAVVSTPSPIGDDHLHYGNHQPGAHQHGQGEDCDVCRPQRPPEPAGGADDAGRGPPVGAGHQHPGGDRDACAERREDRGQRNGLPQHHRSAGGAHRPRRSC
jgi:hypothetical protein